MTGPPTRPDRDLTRSGMRGLLDKVGLAGKQSISELPPRWDDIPKEMAEDGAEIFVFELLQAGHQDLTVRQLGTLMGILNPDGTWA